MAGVFRHPFLLGQSKGVTGLYNGLSGYLRKTFTTAADQKRWAFSSWLKPGVGGNTYQRLIGVGGEANYTSFLNLIDGKLMLYSDTDQGGTQTDYNSLNRYSDIIFDLNNPEWKHVVVIFDSTKGVEVDRVRAYADGAQVNMPENWNLVLNETCLIGGPFKHTIGGNESFAGSSSHFYNGPMAQTQFVTGASLEISDFGEMIDGHWHSKKYAGNFGTNGFCAEYQDGENLALDTSGNNTNWEVVGGLNQTDDVPLYL